jgi:adenosylmethionine-8-amino-7-oxononanoate aminotransferase
VESDVLADYWRAPRPVAVAGRGVWITDAAGRRYLDAAGSVHVVSVGHGVREIAEAITRQAERLAFASGRYFVSEAQLDLAELIGGLAPEPLNHCYFASGGSEAIELALQMAYYWQTLQGKPEKTKFLGQFRSYHGGTIATVSLGGHQTHRDRLAPYLLPFPHVCATPAEHASANSFAEQLNRLILEHGSDTVCAFVAEPVSGTTSGAIVPPPGWWEAVRAVCDAHDVLFIADEVVTGFGRTGRSFGIQHWNATPDIIVGSKSISSGYAPLAVVVVHDHLAEAFHGANRRLPLRLTYAGNPLACATGLAVQQYILRYRLVERCQEMGEYLRALLADLSAEVSVMGLPRGLGLLIGIPIWRDVKSRAPFPRAAQIQERIVMSGLRHGLILVGGTGSDESEDGDHLLLSPPFVISKSECRSLVERLHSTFEHALGEELSN